MENRRLMMAQQSGGNGAHGRKPSSLDLCGQRGFADAVGTAGGSTRTSELPSARWPGATKRKKASAVTTIALTTDPNIAVLSELSDMGCLPKSGERERPDRDLVPLSTDQIVGKRC